MIPVKMRNPTVIHSAQSFGGWTPTKKIKIADRIERTATSLKRGSPRSRDPIFVQVYPWAISPSAMGIAKEKNKKMTVQETAIVWAEAPAIVMSEAPQTNRKARVAPVQIAVLGVRWAWLTFFRKLEPTKPSSRAKAKIMRDAEVTVARPQRNWHAVS
jgi:hypothetical protein